MSPGAMGLLIGLAMGLALFLLLRLLATRVEYPETVKVLNVVGLADLVVLPVVGYLVGSYGWS